MLFGLYAPVPHVTVGSDLVRRSIEGALGGLPDGQVDAQMQVARDVLLLADEAGFDIALFAERHRGPDLEAWILAAAIASQTKRIKIMTAVHPGLWHPTLISKMAASLDRVAPGRSSINIVTGWNEVEARMFGGDVLLGDDQRYDRAEEFVSVLRGMWENTPFSFDGAHYRVDGSELLLKPASAIEIFAASRSERGLDMVARTADWWFVGHDPRAGDAREVTESLRRAISDMNARAARYGRRIRYAFNPFVAMGHDPAAARAHVEQLLLSASADADRAKMLDYIGPAMNAGCIGAPERVREQLLAYRAIGIELFLFKFVPTAEEIHMIRDEIIKPLRTA
ncbi:MAG: LLM class flavin-dependent oxidoreductase [Beijerinckiaceae bacterium]|jgi:dimethylsulfone monooxygenase|nr:LLM class flavin-dependent oxidoreductase [Beijerinckiaceae bacterium]